VSAAAMGLWFQLIEEALSERESGQN
jgi:hypothetical protein